MTNACIRLVLLINIVKLHDSFFLFFFFFLKERTGYLKFIGQLSPVEFKTSSNLLLKTRGEEKVGQFTKLII